MLQIMGYNRPVLKQLLVSRQTARQNMLILLGHSESVDDTVYSDGGTWYPEASWT